MKFLASCSLLRWAALTVPLILPSLAVAQQTALLAAPALPDAPLPSSAFYEGTMAVSSNADGGQSSSAPTPVASPAQSSGTQPPMTEEERRKAAAEQLNTELHQRMAGVVPNFNAVLSGTAVPLSPGQKMHAAFRSAIDPYQFGLQVFTSAIGQATDSHSSYDANGTHHGYPQGWGGYGMRYGANYLDLFNGTIIGNGILPVLLHQDPRYYRMGTGTIKKRILYSLSTTVICHSDKGKWQPNVSNVLGNLISGGISNFYYPRAERGAGLTIEQGFLVTAEGSFGALLIEFYPDIRKHIHGKRIPGEPNLTTH